MQVRTGLPVSLRVEDQSYTTTYKELQKSSLCLYSCPVRSTPLSSRTKQIHPVHSVTVILASCFLFHIPGLSLLQLSCWLLSSPECCSPHIFLDPSFKSLLKIASSQCLFSNHSTLSFTPQPQLLQHTFSQLLFFLYNLSSYQACSPLGTIMQTPLRQTVVSLFSKIALTPSTVPGTV